MKDKGIKKQEMRWFAELLVWGLGGQIAHLIFSWQ